METILLLFGVICSGYNFYLVWFRPSEYSHLLEELYTESSHTLRSVARSKFTLWGFRILSSVLFLAMLLSLLAMLASRVIALIT